ncbi:protease serine 11F [Seminavis robusta]|uniref:Protease serine 11F n=1 Tax=Seminavis robusta TaxID=568900 RepID=A0A9N8DQ27_9STRA|nr:protease serine 11F [Seminavis robusta]|eukprot:Sro204_g085840.1 protease serine 11F (349) ;mRNA; f:26570-27835
MLDGPFRIGAAVLLALVFVVLGKYSPSSYKSLSHSLLRQLQRESEEVTTIEVNNTLIDGVPVGGILEWFVELNEIIFERDGRLVRSTAYCAATLIRPNIVLTAAHCLINGCPFNVRVGPRLRTEDSGNNPGGTKVNVVEGSCRQHPDYGQQPNRFDVAVFKLEFEVSQDVIAVNNDPNIPPDGVAVNAYGFGIFNNDDSDPSDIMNMKQQVYDETCPNIGTNYLEEFMLCAEMPPAACRGDSGGPLVYYADTGTGYPLAIQVGISSFIEDRNLCGNGTDVHTRVSAFSDWIERQSEELQSYNPPVVTQCCAAASRVYYSFRFMAQELRSNSTGIAHSVFSAVDSLFGW